MRRWGLIGLAMAAIGCSGSHTSKPWSAEGVWQAALPGSASGVTQAMWQDTRIRFKPDGTFVEYGGLKLSGRYEAQDHRLHLVLDKFFDKDIDYFNAKMSPIKAMGGQTPPSQLDITITPDGNLLAEPFPPGPGSGAVPFRRAIEEPIESELRSFVKLDDDDAAGAVGQGIWDDIVARKDEAVPVLVSLLKDPDRQIRYWSVCLLADCPDPKAVAPLIQTLHDSGRGNRSAAARALAHLGNKDAIDPIIEALRDRRISDYDASRAFAQLGDRRAVKPLLEALTRSNNPQYIIDGLGELGDPAALPALRALESKPSADVMISLCGAIAKLDPNDPYPKSKTPELLKLARGSDWMQQNDAMHALLSVGDPRAKSVFIGLLEDKKAFVRRDAAEVLGRLRAKEAAPAIRKLLNDDSDIVRTAAKRALRLLEP